MIQNSEEVMARVSDDDDDDATDDGDVMLRVLCGHRRNVFADVCRRCAGNDSPVEYSVCSGVCGVAQQGMQMLAKLEQQKSEL